MSIVLTLLADDKRFIVASKSHNEKYGKPETPSDLKQHKIVSLTGLEVWDFKASQGVNSIKTANYLRMDNGEAVRDACIQGCGITLTATWCSYPYLESDELVQIVLDYPLATDCALWAVYLVTVY
jgi:DNA-binding transcriptional LysR family regulator|tara:strand:- start:199 stop:573 length:375 start_codon:yes stop_codon:yes gene_type:complete